MKYDEVVVSEYMISRDIFSNPLCMSTRVTTYVQKDAAFSFYLFILLVFNRDIIQFTDKSYKLKMKFIWRDSKPYPYIVFTFQQIFSTCFHFLWIEIFLTRCKIILQLASSLLCVYFHYRWS